MSYWWQTLIYCYCSMSKFKGLQADWLEIIFTYKTGLYSRLITVKKSQA